MSHGTHKVYTVVTISKTGEKLRVFRTTKMSKAESYLYKTALKDKDVARAYIETEHRQEIRGIFRED